jgi:hypothetical protein
MAKSGPRIMVLLDLSLKHGVGDKASQKKLGACKLIWSY